MSYIVKSSLEIASTIIPWNEKENQRLMKEKKEYLEKEKKLKAKKEVEKHEVKEIEKQEEEKTPVFKNTKKDKKAGEK